MPLGSESEFTFAVYVFAAFYVVHGATTRDRAVISLSKPRVPKYNLHSIASGVTVNGDYYELYKELTILNLARFRVSSIVMVC